MRGLFLFLKLESGNTGAGKVGDSMKRGVRKQALRQRLRKNRIEERLRADLEATKRSLESAESNFQNVVDEELIDCCIYEVNAAQSRYAFLLRKLKEFQGVTCENP